MPKLPDQLFNGLMLAYFGIFAVAVYFGLRFQSRLKQRHPGAWREFGQRPLFNNSILSGFKSTKWMLQKKFEELNDPTLNFYGRGMRVGFLAIFFSILAIAALMLVAQYQNGVWKQSMVVTHPLNAVGASFLILFAAAFISYSLMTKRLKDCHPQIWKELGEPTAFLNNTPSNTWKVNGFVWRWRFIKLSDTQLSLCIRLSILVSPFYSRAYPRRFG